VHGSSFLQGAAIGFAIAAPVGPIGVLCIRRSVAHGRRIGLLSGLGAATADAVYGSIAAFGLTAVTDLLLSQRLWLGAVGGAFLCYLGAKTFVSPPASAAGGADADSPMSAYLSTVLVTLANPTTILSFVAIFAGLGVGVGGGYARASAMVAGVFVGSALWWLILSGAAAAFRSRLGPASLRAVNRVSGVVIAGFGVYTLLSIAQ
jgi:threonine/homoserine/homoserine lactone efflux protein